MTSDLDPGEILPLPPDFVECEEAFDQFVIGFPRSGSRWVAIMMMHFARAANGLDTEWLYERAFQSESKKKLPPIPLEQTFVRNVYDPDVDWELFASRSIPEFPVVCRSHTCEGIAEREGIKIVYTVRHPVAMAESYIAFAKEQNLIAPDQDDCKEFVESRIREWMVMVDRTLELSKIYPEKFLFLEYKEGIPFNVEDLIGVMNHLNLPRDPDECQTVIDRLATLRDRLNQPGVCQYMRFGQTGTTGESTNGIDPELWSEAEKVHQAALELCI